MKAWLFVFYVLIGIGAGAANFHNLEKLKAGDKSNVNSAAAAVLFWPMAIGWRLWGVGDE